MCFFYGNVSLTCSNFIFFDENRYSRKDPNKVMAKDKSQLNIKIDPQLLLRLKSEAIKSGKTLTDFVTNILEQAPVKVTTDIDILEKRLLRVEKQLNLKVKSSSDKKEEVNESMIIFSNSGAKRYGEVAKELFELHRKEKKLSL